MSRRGRKADGGPIAEVDCASDCRAFFGVLGVHSLSTRSNICLKLSPATDRAGLVGEAAETGGFLLPLSNTGDDTAELVIFCLLGVDGASTSGSM